MKQIPAQQNYHLAIKVVHYDVASKSDPDNTCSLFNREDTGAMLGITTQTASRTISEFKRQRLLVETALMFIYMILIRQMILATTS